VAISGSSMALNLASYLADGNYLLLVTGAVILALQVWVILEGLLAVRRHRAVPSEVLAP
jgi:carbon starvation protein